MSELSNYRKVLSLVALGLCIIPIRAGTKIPLQEWREFQSRRPTHEELADWFENTRHTWGIVTGAISGIIVVDCDSARAKEWADANLEPTPLVVLTQQGEHRYYRHAGVRTANKARIKTGEKGLELDLRGDGGYVMGPMAVHPKGCLYTPVGWREIFQQGGPGWDAVPLFDSSWLPAEEEPRESVSAKSSHTNENRPDNFTRAAQYVSRIPGAGEGSRNTTSSQTAYKIAQGWDLCNETGFSILANWNQASNSPPLPTKELRQVWGSACKAAPPAGMSRGWF